MAMKPLCNIKQQFQCPQSNRRGKFTTVTKLGRDTWKHFSLRDYMANGLLNCTAHPCSVRTTSFVMDYDRVVVFFSKGWKIFHAVGGGKNKYVSKKERQKKKITQWLIVNIPTVEIHEWATLGLVLAGSVHKNASRA